MGLAATAVVMLVVMVQALPSRPPTWGCAGTFEALGAVQLLGREAPPGKGASSRNTWGMGCRDREKLNSQVSCGSPGLGRLLGGHLPYI